MAKQKFRITNWSTYNKALINRGSLTFWLDDEAIQAWYESATPSSRGRPQRYSDLAITTVLVIKRVFRLTLRAAQGFIDSIFALMNVPLRCPDYTSVSKRAKSVNVSFKTSTRGEIAHLVIDSTGLKVFGEGEWKVRKHGKERRRIWRKLHLAVDSNTHEVVCADLSLNNVTDSEAFPGLIRQTHRKIRAAAADGAYDTRLCHDELRRKKISALIPPRKGAGYWPGEYADRNRAVANQRLSGSNARWKWTTEYNRRSIAETAMYRMKQLLGDSLTLRDYDGQVAEAMAMVRALNRMTKAGMPESVRIAWKSSQLQGRSHEILFIQQSRHANEREVSELPISIAIGDVTITKSLEDAVNALNTSSLVAAMGEINQTLNTGSGSSSGSGSGGGTATPPPALTEEQIESLKVATEQFGVVFNQTTAPTVALQQQYERVKESANVAITAYNHAIGTALAEASANKASTASAVAALVPDSVLDELNKAAR